MHAQQTKERFIELRGRGWSLARLSQELALSKSTCIRWQKEFRSLIENLPPKLNAATAPTDSSATPANEVAPS
jgi:transposase-like protein